MVLIVKTTAQSSTS